jgi:hypothetical protein
MEIAPDVQVALVTAVVGPVVLWLLHRIGKQAKDKPDTRNGIMETMQWLRGEVKELRDALIHCQTDCEREKAELRARLGEK